MQAQPSLKAQLCDASQAACGLYSMKEVKAQRRQRKKLREQRQQVALVPGMPVDMQQVLQTSSPHQLHVQAWPPVKMEVMAPLLVFPSSSAAACPMQPAMWSMPMPVMSQQHPCILPPQPPSTEHGGPTSHENVEVLLVTSSSSSFPLRPSSRYSSVSAEDCSDGRSSRDMAGAHNLLEIGMSNILHD